MSDHEMNGRAPEPARATNGQFGAGNTFGKGNPHLKRVHALRSAMLNAVDDAAMGRLGAKLLALAEGGDLEAMRLLLSYTLGRPAAAVELSGPDGQPLAVGGDRLTSAILGALARFPEAKVAVAATLGRLADGDG